MPLLPSAFQDLETMALGRKIEQPKPKKECPIAAFERGDHSTTEQMEALMREVFLDAVGFNLPALPILRGVTHAQALRLMNFEMSVRGYGALSWPTLEIGDW